ncbi:DUF6414 family protein [Microbacterium testaceum]|uniref:DUF6414 family protein n=1 Tax=Microbacterium testaceum TaxID=2033 RepID=UPI0007DF76D3|nr:DUF6414 family protein [Microbacterium testaceum]KTS04772.1 hypothetical protein NS283_08205 [Microbacterium testaceum]
MTKIVYFDEESASDYLDISAGGKETSTRENIKERAKSTHADVETSLIAKLSWLPFFGGSAEVSAGAGLSAAGRSILNKTLSNTILTDYLEKSEGDQRVLQLRDLRVAAPKDSMAYMKMYTPYMVVLKMDGLPLDLARLDEALTGAKGYYELFGIGPDGSKRILRFNIRAFRNSYGLADLGRMRLVFHGILVGQTAESDLGMKAEMSLNAGDELVTAVELIDGTPTPGSELLDVYDVLLAGVEHVG